MKEYSHPFHHKSILVVENQKLVGHLLVDFFSKQPNLTIAGMATHYEEALERCQSRNPDIVTVEIELMGECTGIELIASLRASGYAGKVVVLTSETRPELVRRAIQAGASAYITKFSSLDSILQVFAELFDPKLPGECIFMPEELRLSTCIRESSGIPEAIETELRGMISRGISFEPVLQVTT
jgi:DNA-binding NarL/FixJ family response regulator